MTPDETAQPETEPQPIVGTLLTLDAAGKAKAKKPKNHGKRKSRKRKPEGAGPHMSKKDAIDYRVMMRGRMALELRLSGANYHEIAATMREQEGVSDKYSISMAYEDVHRELRRIREKNEEIARDVLTLEMSRLDRMLSFLEPSISLGDIGAIGTALRIMDRRDVFLGLSKKDDAKKTPDEVAREIRKTLMGMQKTTPFGEAAGFYDLTGPPPHPSGPEDFEGGPPPPDLSLPKVVNP
ncbi:MAG TPA: hypothetical protein VFF76_09725 [Holophagaceae bacterium]|nr:hypothetical protein [Holophagaceae bacterium]